MCGIAGEVHSDRSQPGDRERVQRMADALQHRGPDGQGVHAGPGYALGHRRLAIVDLDGGAQPMEDGTGELWITFNGEIYNHQELRGELEAAGYRFRSRSDTEVLLHGYRAWGERLPERLVGMFAFAIYDERRAELFAARDRIGQKPLYYAQTPAGLSFASEIKALLVRGDVGRALQPESVAQFFCLRYVADPDTIFAGVHKLPPAHWMRYSAGTLEQQRYWQLSFANTRGSDVEEIGERVLEVLDDAVGARLMSDVPLGAFLSGGVDSFAVVDSMARMTSTPVIACGIGFDDPRFDELEHIRDAATACRADLHESVLRVGDMLALDWFADTFDEPFADSSAIPTYHVSVLARRHVTVALSGDGGDESFGGYRRYRFDDRENTLRARLPRAVWQVLGALYPKFDYLPRWLRFKRTLQNLALDPAEAYARSVSASLPEEVAPLLCGAVRAAGREGLAPVVAAYRAGDGPDPLARAAATDFATYLPGDILTKVDRASMAVSLEVRAPFLDHRLVELAAAIPSPLKLQGHQTKGLLRRALRPRLGDRVMSRPKKGFSVPLRRWMAGALGTELDLALQSGRVGDWLDIGAVRSMLARHRSGQRDHGELLWAVLVFDRFVARWLR